MIGRGLIVVAMLAALVGCSRPQAVRSLASSALPVAVSINASAEAQQKRFALHRREFDGRATELTAQAALGRAQVVEIEADWKLANNTTAPKQLAELRAGDAALRADPLASLVIPTPPVESKPPKLDLGPLKKVIGGFGTLRAERKMTAMELFAYAGSVNEKLKEIEEEEAGN